MRKVKYVLVIAVALAISIFASFTTPSAFSRQQAETQSSRPKDLVDTQNIQIELTKEEKAFLQTHPVIRFGASATWTPYIVKGEDGTLKGFDVDILRCINEATGSNIQLVTGQWDVMVQKARAGEIDGLAHSVPLKEREPHFIFSDVYVSEDTLLLVRSDTTLNITQLGDLAGKTIVFQEGVEFYESLLKPYPDTKIINSDSETKSVAMLLEGKADVAFIGTATYNTHIEKFRKLIKIGYVVDYRPVELVYSIRKDWPELLSIINKGLASLPPEAKDSIYSDWFGFNLARFPADKKEERIPLTAREQEWIKAHPEIRLGVDPAWQPLEFIDKMGQYQGMISDYVRILNKRLGINMKVLPNMSWAQLMEVMPQKGVDVISAVIKTPKVEEYLDYTDPYFNIGWVVIRLRDTPRISSLSDFEGRIVAVGEGYPTQDFVAKQYPGIHVLPKKNTLDVLQSVIEGKADAALLERITANMIIHAYRMYDLKVDHHVMQHDRPISLAVRNDWPELVQILNKGLASITPEEREIIEQKWMAVPIQIGFTGKDVLRIVLYVVAVLGLFQVFFLIWNRRLQKEITERKQAEEALKESEAKYRELVQNANSIILRMDTKGEIIFLNEFAQDFFGYSENEVLGKNGVGTIIPKTETTGSDFSEMIKDIGIRPELYISNENENIKRNHERVWIVWTNKAIRNKEGEISEILCIGNDITERKQAEEALRESEERYRALFEYNPVDTIVVDNEAKIMMCNLIREKTAGMKPEIGMVMYKDYAAKHQINMFEELMDSIRSGNQKEFFDLNYNEQILHIRIAPFSGGAIITSIDTTPVRKLESKLQQFQKLESLGLFAGGIAHDFNNILTTILGNVSMAKLRVSTEDEIFDLLNEAETASVRAQTLTKHLLTFAKGGAPLKETALIKDILKESSHFVLRGSKSSCEFSIAEKLWPAEVDVGQISQVINNIVINANQAMPDGGIIQVSAENLIIDDGNELFIKPRRYINISISDQGVGIAEKHFLKIFDPYFTTKYAGSGLGLATSYSIIKRHDGHITVESQLGVGTTFHIYLPASDKIVPEKEKVKLIKGHGRILVMDDEASLRKVVGRMLKNLGYESEFAKDGAEAIWMYKEAQETEEPYDAVILDLTVPGKMGGKEAINKLLEIDPEVKAIVSSGYSEDSVLANFQEYGFRGMMPKPFESRSLGKVLHEVLKEKGED